jgi:hypothetical protein
MYMLSTAIGPVEEAPAIRMLAASICDAVAVEAMLKRNVNLRQLGCAELVVDSVHPL